MSDAPPEKRNHLAEAARKHAERVEAGRRDPEPSLGRRLGQIGALGWTIVGPMLLGLLLGRWLDGLAGTPPTFAAALLMVGAGLGLWLAWRWMKRP